VTNAPTTPIPRGGLKIPAQKQKRSSAGVVIGALVVVAAGVGGYLALAPKQAAPPIQPVAPASPPTARVPVETVRVTVPPPVTRQEPRRGNPRQVANPLPPPPAAAAQGFISVNSNPPGNLFIDGRDLGPVPVIEEPVTPGRHTIRVERAGYKTRSETVDVPSGGTVRKTWQLEPEGSN
jgi:hypothetical protein